MKELGRLINENNALMNEIEKMKTENLELNNSLSNNENVRL